MHLVLQEAAKHYEYALSILYLRCLNQQLNATLNALQQLSILYLRCFCCQAGPRCPGPLRFQFSI